jgi:hypothetical protein
MHELLEVNVALRLEVHNVEQALADDTRQLGVLQLKKIVT